MVADSVQLSSNNKEPINETNSCDNYKKLFGKFIAKEATSLLSGNKKYAASQNLFTNWLNGARTNSLAITGNLGTGSFITTECMKAFCSQQCKVLTVPLARYSIAHDGLAGTLGEKMGGRREAAMDDLLKVINEGDKIVIFLENCENLFVRRVGGFDALFDLHHLLSFSRKKVFWVTNWSPYSWYYLDKAIGFKNFFDSQISFQAIDSISIIKWLQQRHDSTGFTASFLTEDKSKADSSKGWLPKEHEKTLLASGNGNIKTACDLWLDSINSSKENKHIEIIPPKQFNKSVIDELKEEELYVLCSLLFHKEISLDYLSEDMNLTPLQTRMIIDRLCDKNIVYSKEDRTKFTIALSALPSVLQLLAGRNLINIDESNACDNYQTI